LWKRKKPSFFIKNLKNFIPKTMVLGMNRLKNIDFEKKENRFKGREKQISKNLKKKLFRTC